jgi:hypothetical protein
MDWYKHDIPKYVAETDELPDAEDLAYRRMRDIYYTTEKPFPPEIETVSDWVKLDDDVVAPVLESFLNLPRRDMFMKHGRRRLITGSTLASPTVVTVTRVVGSVGEWYKCFRAVESA